MFSGRCLCGGIQFRIHSELAPIEVCHCTQCRHAQGTPFATNIPVQTSAFELVSGADLLTDFESSPGKIRAFCRGCGSPIHSRRTARPDTIRIRAGLISGPLSSRPAFHFNTASQCNWWPIADDLPQFPHAHTPQTGISNSAG